MSLCDCLYAMGLPAALPGKSCPAVVFEMLTPTPGLKALQSKSGNLILPFMKKLMCSLLSGPVLSVILFSAALPGATALADELNGRGPALVRDVYPLAALHYAWSPKSPGVLALDESSMGVTFLGGSTNAIRESYRIDSESRDLRFKYTRGVIKNGELSVEIPVVWRGGGVLDPSIDSWHDLWSLPQGNRNDVPDNEYFVFGLDDNGGTFDLDRSGTRLGNVVLSGKYTLLPGAGGAPQVAVDVALSLPTSSDTLGHKGLDVLAGVIGGYALGHWNFYLGVAGLFVGDTESQQVRYERWRGESFGTVEYAFEDFSLFAGATLTSGVVSNVSEHPDYSGYMDFGVAVDVTESCIFDLVLRENLVSGRGGLDVAFLVGLRWNLSSTGLRKERSHSE